MLIFFAGTIPLLGSSARGAYDRVWWESTAQDERTQFIAGYLDCAAYDLGKTRLAEAPWNVIGPKITSYYASHPDAGDRTVPSLILALGPGSVSTGQAGEKYPGKHGIFDGEYWREISPPGRVGFVEGYFACRNAGPEARQFATYSADWYVRQIDRAYGLTREGNVDDAGVSKKIATIIQAFANQPSSHQSR